eukprot:GFKZ01015762.1.p3 GENE.GFKZ01015762.1~~GFKZ01015762.1.p3  ORF type:complete len:119 (+),score=1.12 GFKZ01015762.1:482-838(+)
MPPVQNINCNGTQCIQTARATIPLANPHTPRTTPRHNTTLPLFFPPRPKQQPIKPPAPATAVLHILEIKLPINPKKKKSQSRMPAARDSATVQPTTSRGTCYPASHTTTLCTCHTPRN